MTSKTVAVIVLNWNGWRDTIDCVDSLVSLENEGIGIFVCDNASTDDSITRIRGWLDDNFDRSEGPRSGTKSGRFRWQDLSGRPTDGGDAQSLPEDGLDTITLIQTGRNGGYAAGNNVGLRYALANKFDYFWVINNDVEVEPDAVKWLLARMQEGPDIGICGSTLVYAGQRDTVQALGGATFERLRGWGRAIGAHTKVTDTVDRDFVESQLRFINGAAMFISRPFLETVGLMQEDYFLYWEELDWACRARGLFKLGYAPKSIVYHKVGASIGTNDFGDPSPLSEFYMASSHIKFCLRFSKISLPLVAFDIAKHMLRWLRKGKFSRVVLLSRAMFGLPYKPL